jgi:hypothetical protein
MMEVLLDWPPRDVRGGILMVRKKRIVSAAGDITKRARVKLTGHALPVHSKSELSLKRVLGKQVGVY